jgi:hypothetical protein
MTLPAAPLHLVPVALLLLVSQAVLAADYLNFRFALLTELPSLSAVFDEGARWVGWAWAAAVWAGAGGAVLLAMRDGGAVVVLFLSAAAALASVTGAALTGHATLIDFLGVPWPAVSALIVAFPFLGWAYARALRTRALLR